MYVARHDLATLLPNLERELPAVGALDIARGVVLLERGCLDEAEISLQQGINLVSQGTSPYYLLVGYHALYRLMTYQNRELEANSALEQLETVWPDIGFLTRGLLVLQNIRHAPDQTQTLSLCKQWLQGFQVDLFSGLPGMGPFGAAEAYYQSFLIWIRIQVHLGNIEKTRDIYDNLLQSALENNLSTRIIELSLLEAEIAGITKDTQQSDTAIERALGVAGGGIFLQIFRQNPSITRILTDFASRHPTYPNITCILEEITPPLDRDHPIGNQSFDQFQNETQPSIVSSLPEPLTNREVEILALISHGSSNQDIANQVSPDRRNREKPHQSHFAKTGCPFSDRCACPCSRAGTLRKVNYLPIDILGFLFYY